MDERLTALEQAFRDYREALAEYERKRKPTDGLFGFGRSAQDEPCHAIFDSTVERIVREMADMPADAETAAQAAERLLLTDEKKWPTSAQWMLVAAQRHAIPLVSLLTPAQAGDLRRRYEGRYRRYERLPVQREALNALLKREKA